MSLGQPCHSQAASFRSDYRSTFHRNHSKKAAPAAPTVPTRNNFYFHGNDYPLRNCNDFHDFARKFAYDSYNPDCVNPQIMPPLKKRKFSASACENGWRSYQQSNSYNYVPSACKTSSFLPSSTRPDTNANKSAPCKRDRASFEDGVAIFMSRDEIERCSPSRKDGIDALHETNLRYSYCAFLQDLGFRLDLPQTTIGTAMVLCHRFFVRRSHAFHDRFLVATAALFLAAKSEETPCPLNNVLRASSEVFHKQDFSFLLHMLPADWFEQYRERVMEAEQLILTTLDFELNVQHPYAPLTSMFDKLGLSQSVLVNLSLKLVSEGLRSSLWLQFKPHQIAAGAAFLAAKYLNMDLTSYDNVWHEFQTPYSVVQDVAQQLMELF